MHIASKVFSLNVDYTNLIGLEKLRPEQLSNIADSAKALSREEACILAQVDYESLSTIEKEYVDSAVKMGRASGKKLAADALFKQMNSKGGAGVVIAYLTKFGDDFKGVDGEKKSFTFIVDM